MVNLHGIIRDIARASALLDHPECAVYFVSDQDFKDLTDHYTEVHDAASQGYLVLLGMQVRPGLVGNSAPKP